MDISTVSGDLLKRTGDVGKNSRTYAAVHVVGGSSVASYAFPRASYEFQLVAETLPAPGKTVKPHYVPS
nr:hypothetical protein [Mesorhizobium sp. LCM 4577]